jgi:DNA-binding PadR family transcriptional regulator
MHLEDISKYTSIISKYQPTNLGDVESLFLIKIAGGPKSAYSLFSQLKSQSKPMAYRNVHKRLKRLEELKFIEQEKEEQKFKRNAIYYKLTTFGLFYILSKHPISWEKDLLIKYREDIILKTLLYPYFEENTIENCGFMLRWLIAQYLRDCCNITLDVFSKVEGTHENLVNRFNVLRDNVTKSYNEWLAGQLKRRVKEFVSTLGPKSFEKYWVPPSTYIPSANMQIDIAAKNEDIKNTISLLSKDKTFMQHRKLAADEDKDDQRTFKIKKSIIDK